MEKISKNGHDAGRREPVRGQDNLDLSLDRLETGRTRPNADDDSWWHAVVYSGWKPGY